jgi:hypothetical protein
MPIFPPAIAKAFTVPGSSMTLISHFHDAESGRRRFACSMSRPAISLTRLLRAVPDSIFFWRPKSPIISRYAVAELEIACSSETTKNWLRPVIGFSAQPATIAAIAASSATVRNRRCPRVIAPPYPACSVRFAAPAVAPGRLARGLRPCGPAWPQ